MWQQILFWTLIILVALALVWTRNIRWISFKTRIFIALLLPILILFFIVFSSVLIVFFIIIGILILILAILGIIFGFFRIKTFKYKQQ